jgi:hypothetical protein
VEPFTGRATDRPLRQTNEYIHPSVRTRFRLEGPGIQDRGLYDPRGLTDNYRLAIDYGPDIQKLQSGDAEVYWKVRSRDTNGVRVLPEAPLWRLERELARKDPRTYDYYKRPPATASTKKSRRAPRPHSADVSPSGAPSAALPSPSPRKTRRETFSPRSTFPAEERGARRRSVVGESAPKRSKSRARSASFDERETEIRESMPHRREKDRAWWEGMGRR